MARCVVQGAVCGSDGGSGTHHGCSYALDTYEEMFDYGVVEDGEGIHNTVRNLPATAQGKRVAMNGVGNGKGVFIRMGPASTIFEVTGARHSSGVGYLVATADADAKREVSFGNFFSGGVAIGGDVVTHIFEGVTEGSLFRRRCTAQESALRDVDWRLTKVRFDGTFYFEIGLSDGTREGIVGGMTNVKAYAAEEFFRLFRRPLILDHTNRPADERAGADVAELLVGSSEKRTEQHRCWAGGVRYSIDGAEGLRRERER